MSRARSFPPVADPRATLLILGSMPGVASLNAQQYYAHPRNAFWRILGELVGAGPELPYAQRLERLKDSGIALWDALESCVRIGSLDADIEPASAVANDFAAFFLRHPRVDRVFFNGAKAEECYRRYALPRLAGFEPRYLRLPSTSPAHAGMSFDKKLAAWRAILAADRSNGSFGPAPAGAAAKPPR